MILNKDTAQQTANLLLQINAIKLQPQNPFTWASGWKSPIYCDNRIILSFPEVRNFIKENLAQQISELYEKPDIIAGVATGAIGIGALVADFLGLPFCYVRPDAKKHGRKNKVEGYLKEGQKVLVVEDLISTGKSSLMAVEALQEANANVMGMMAVFTYGFDVATKNFEESNVTLHTLSDYSHLIQLAEKSNYITNTEATLLSQWREDPGNWSK